MERGFGRDFGDVRIHTDSLATESAQAVDAVAYAAGNDVVFANGQYAPGSPQGRRLLAHELAHVVQQAYGPPRLARQQKVAQYETRGIAIDRAQMERAAHIGYWSEKLQEYGFTPRLDPRLFLDGEEQSAVLAAAWQIKPQPGIAQPVTKMITVPNRPAFRGSKDVTYEVTFRPAPAANQKGDVELVFVFEGAAVSPEVPSTSFTPKTTGFPESKFPQNNPPAYWQGMAKSIGESIAGWKGRRQTSSINCSPSPWGTNQRLSGEGNKGPIRTSDGCGDRLCRQRGRHSCAAGLLLAPFFRREYRGAADQAGPHPSGQAGQD